MIQQPTSLSGFWRVNKSADKAVELKQLQESLQSLAGTLARSKGANIRVVWDVSMADMYADSPDTSTFALDASPIMDTATPVPDSRVDVLAGQVLHHVGHMVVPLQDVMRQKIISNILRYRDAGKIPWHDGSNTYSELGIIAKVLQEWQIDTYLSDQSPAIREYIAKARDWYKDAAQDRIQDAVDRCGSENATFKDVVDLWSLLLCYGLPVPDKIDSKVGEALVQAIGASGKLTKSARLIDRVVSDIWRAFNVFARSITQPEQQSQDGGQSTDQKGEQGEAQDQEGSSDSSESPEEGEGGDNSEREPTSGQSDVDSSPSSEEGRDEDKGEGADDEDEGEEGEETGEEDSPPSGSNGSKSDKDSESSEGGEAGQGGSKAGQGGQDDSEGAGSGIDECPCCGEHDLFDGETCNACGYSESPPDLDTDMPGYFASALDQQQMSLGQEDIQELKEAIESEREDISQQLAGFGHGTVIMQLAPRDNDLAHRLLTESEAEANAVQHLFQNWHRSKSRYVRGKEQGSIDQRLLYRGGLKDNHVFRAREVSQKLDMALCVLIDASSSIRESQWDIIRHCTAAFVESMGSRTDTDLIVLGYSTGRYDDHVYVYRVWDPSRQEMRVDFNPTGGTPTASAIAACQDVIFKRFSRRRDKLIIHISDGCPNMPISEATDQILRAAKSGIQVALVETPLDIPIHSTAYGAGLSPYMQQVKEHIDQAYGKNHVRIARWQDLPTAMEDLLRTMLAQR